MSRGFTVVELLVASTITLLVLSAVLAAYVQIDTTMAHVDAAAAIQGNLRVGMDRMVRDLRMIGFGVPSGTRIGGSDSWAPVIFNATPSQIGFRAELDAGNAEIVCTPSSSNSDCPRNKLRLDSIDYYQQQACDPPDGASGDLALIAVANVNERWQPVTCSGFSAADDSITVTNVANNTFIGGASAAYTIEQVYLRYTARSSPPYGSITRYVRYANTPNTRFPPSGVTGDVIATGLTDFWLEYQDASGTTLNGNPLTQAQRESVAKIVIFLEGYEDVGASGSQLAQVRSEVLVRNAF